MSAGKGLAFFKHVKMALGLAIIASALLSAENHVDSFIHSIIIPLAYSRTGLGELISHKAPHPLFTSKSISSTKTRRTTTRPCRIRNTLQHGYNARQAPFSLLPSQNADMNQNTPCKPFTSTTAAIPTCAPSGASSPQRNKRPTQSSFPISTAPQSSRRIPRQYSALGSCYSFC